MSLADSIYDQIQALTVGQCRRLSLGDQPWTLPATTYQRIDTIPEYSHGGDSNLDHGRWQISCWADTHPAAEALAKQVRQAMAGWKVAYGQPAFCAGQYDIAQPETGVYQVACDFIIWWKEPI